MVVTLCTLTYKREIVAWITCIVFVCSCGSAYIEYKLDEPQTYYREYQLYVYLAVKVRDIHLIVVYMFRFSISTSICAEIKQRSWTSTSF